MNWELSVLLQGILLTLAKNCKILCFRHSFRFNSSVGTRTMAVEWHIQVLGIHDSHPFSAESDISHVASLPCLEKGQVQCLQMVPNGTRLGAFWSPMVPLKNFWHQILFGTNLVLLRFAKFMLYFAEISYIYRKNEQKIKNFLRLFTKLAIFFGIFEIFWIWCHFRCFLNLFWCFLKK